jgi:hypothetical protein
MFLNNKLQGGDFSYAIKLNTMEFDQKYPISNAERMAEKFGPTVFI